VLKSECSIGMLLRSASFRVSLCVPQTRPQMAATSNYQLNIYKSNVES
jgi:hypothetical protein